MLVSPCIILLLAAAATAKQDQKSSPEDQDGASDKVTSILIHPGPSGPRHVILSDDHQVLSTEGFASRAVGNDYHLPSANYPLQGEDVGFHHTVPPPLHHATYGPARPVTVHSRRPGQLYYHRFGVRSKIPHLKAAKEDGKGHAEAVYKYSTYIKHDDSKEIEEDEDVPHNSKELEKPDYSVTVPERDSYSRNPQHEGLSAYRNRHEEEEFKYRESMGDLNDNEFEKNRDYSSEKKARPLPYSKLYFTKQHRYIPNNLNEKKHLFPTVNHNVHYNSYEDQSYQDKPSGFDDMNGGKVVPLLAKFYKHPLPIIHTQLPADNTGVYLQFFPQAGSAYDRDEVSNNYFEQYPQEKSSLKSGFQPSDSEWTPINAPDGAVPAKSYDIPAPDLSLGKVVPGKVFRRGSDSSSVVVGKSKQSMLSNQRIQGNSEGVVSAVVRVKQ